MITPRTRKTGPQYIASALALTIGVALTGCTVDNDGTPEETVTMSPAEAAYIPASADGPAQNVPKPVLPTVASENSPEGAIATVSYFWDAIDYGRLTGETEYAGDVAHYVCDLCTTLIYRWEQIYEDHAWAVLHDETQLEVTETHGYFDDQDDRWIAVRFAMTEPASDFYQDGELVEEESHEAETYEGWWAELRYDEDARGWEIRWLETADAVAEAPTS